VLDARRIATVPETLRETTQQIQTPIGFPQQQAAAAGTHRAAVKPSHDFATLMGGKLKAGLGTLCYSKGRSDSGCNMLS